MQDTIQEKMNAMARLQILLHALGLKESIVKNNGYLCSGDACADMTAQAIGFIERMGYK